MDITTPITITAPSSVDGRGEVAVLNDSTSGNFVGYLVKKSGFGGANVRTSADNIVEGHGAVFGSFYYGPRPFTLEVLLAPASTYALSNARFDKLCRAWDAVTADGLLQWTNAGPSIRRMNFRREQPPTDPDEDGRLILAGIAADPRIYLDAAQTGSSPKTNTGNSGTPPTFTLTPTGGNVVLTNTTSGLGSPALTLRVGAGYLSTGSAVTVDFAAKTIQQGGVYVQSAEVWPTSTWWEIVPGANTWTVTNASSVSVSFRDAWLND